MTETLRPDAAEAAPRWPRLLGTLGIVVAVLMFLDNLDDLLLMPLLHSSDWWSRMLGQDLGEQIVRWLPPRAWLVASSLVGIALAGLLFIGSVRLRRRRRSGVALTRMWAWLAIGWLLVEIVTSSSWLARHAGELDALGSAAWQAPTAFGLAAAFAVLLAYPVFLLVWLARPPMQAEYAGWPD